MSWVHSARNAGRRATASFPNASRAGNSLRRFAVPVGTAIAGSALALAQSPLLLESSEPKKYNYEDRMKPRAAPVIKRRVVVEEVVDDAEDLPLGEETAMSLDEEEQESAFDERTGEINWDCPCLGGMAHGPCGEEFKKAFSCFIFSEQEPKGIECVDLFKDMQDCFRKHPEVYAEEIEADNAADAEAQSIAEEAPSATASA
ncbi:hypothetical protein CBS9595_002452 [Malassezia furfur]|nr:hypothetical protein CBS9595_002452 [Malassezia furfur]